ncbi:MAG: CoA-binding protein [Candidatus Lokiarchaeota archaeon]|nr:CoA-binding protein [Candidatus Lokiarchaeota archaeon]
MTASFPKNLPAIHGIRSIADIGASRKRHYTYLKTFRATFKGKLYAIKPGAEPIPEFPDVPVYARVTDVPAGEPVDFAFIEVPREQVAGVIRDCARKGVKLAAIFSSGFADAGTDEGRQLQAELARVIEEEGNDLHVIGPNGMGLYYPRLGIRWRPSLPTAHGGAGIVAQSGGLCNLLIHGLNAAGMPVSTALSIGNAMDITALDALEYFKDDPETDVVVAYLEGIPNGSGKAFMRILGECRKPVILVKGGRTSSGSKAARSHTAAIVGNFAAWQAAARQAGAILVETFEDVIDVARYVTCYGKARAKSACMLTLSGGYGVICSDALASHGVAMPDFSRNESLKESLRQQLVSIGTSVGNPVDVGAFIYEVDKLEAIARTVLADTSVDVLIFEIAPLYVAAGIRPDVHLETALPAMLERVKGRVPKPIVVITEDIGYDDVKADISARLRGMGIPVFDDISHVARTFNYVNASR